ncbi:MAG: GNAT family N-acetyltransferase [Lachnospiraceae bacterium]|nr:GNAT family N-acetyltransferase [Lachnospiraceae bacterium]
MAFCDLFKEFQPIRVDEDIYLRQTDPKTDARPFWEMYYDEENFKHFGFYKRPGEWDEERELRVQESRLKGFKGKREYTWVVTLKGETIGQIQLFNFGNHNTMAEVGYFIKRTYWNQGINTKVLKVVCRFGFEVMGLERIEAHAHVDNIGSNRTLVKAGFTKEGTLRRRFCVNGGNEDGNIYSILREDIL